MSEKKPIMVYASDLSGNVRFFATQHYREDAPGQFVCTGKKYDVTQDVLSNIVRYQLDWEEIIADTVAAAEGNSK